MIDSRGEKWADLAADFAPPRLLSTVAIGLVLAMVNSLLSVALMSLIFAGNLDEALPMGIAAGLLTSAVVALIIALGSGFAGMYAGIQDSSAAILAVAASGIAATVAGPTGTATVFAILTVTSALTGLSLLLMARFRLGEMARYVPYPVIGGLVAGTGYLIAAGALDLLVNQSPIFGSSSVGLLWPGIALAVIIFLAFSRKWPPQIYLAVIVVAFVGFHLANALGGARRDGLVERGWLLGPFPRGFTWSGLGLASFASADWSAVASQVGAVATVVIVVPLTILLSISALETDRHVDLDLNSELRATGWANLAGGLLAGGPPGYFYLADTLMTHRLLGGRRGPPLLAAMALVGVSLFGGGLLGLIPQFLIGGLLLFVGIDFLYDWLWVARTRMAIVDYVLMLLIVAIIAVVGFLPGVVTGLAAAITLFVYRYSQIDVVKHSLTGAEGQSNIERQPAQAEYLRRHGAEVNALELQGFIFFGTATKVFTEVKKRLTENPDLRFVILDFRQTTGVDSSAVAFLDRIVVAATRNQTIVVLTGLSAAHRRQVGAFLNQHGHVIHEEPDLDHGLAWCEEQILGDAPPTKEIRALPDELSARLAGSLQTTSFKAGDRLMTQGDPAPGIFLIRSGTATVSLEQPGGQSMRVRTLYEGTVLGEISLYMNEPCTATVTAETDCVVDHLTPEAFANVCETDPSTAADLHAFVARTLAGRVGRANDTIRALHS
ncbi:MAG: cyclic nucleotide-binding domain-containing protein [Acidimicrobiia bacterium]